MRGTLAIISLTFFSPLPTITGCKCDVEGWMPTPCGEYAKEVGGRMECLCKQKGDSDEGEIKGAGSSDMDENGNFLIYMCNAMVRVNLILVINLTKQSFAILSFISNQFQ